MAHQTDPFEWIVCGCSPSADEYLRLCQYRYPLASTITTNSGHKLFPGGPTAYFLSDAVACGLAQYRDACVRFKRQGTRLITLKRLPNALKDRGVDWFDEFLEVEGPGADWQFKLGKYTGFSMSGLYALQYALNNGAERVHLVGHEGYRSIETSPEFDHFDGAPGPTNGAHLTRVVIQPAMQAIVNYCRDVEFYFYGVMNYVVTGINVHHIGNHEAVAKDDKSQVWIGPHRSKP